jgi:hypothetical protein
MVNVEILDGPGLLQGVGGAEGGSHRVGNNGEFEAIDLLLQIFDGAGRTTERIGEPGVPGRQMLGQERQEPRTNKNGCKPEKKAGNEDNQ